MLQWYWYCGWPVYDWSDGIVVLTIIVVLFIRIVIVDVLCCYSIILYWQLIHAIVVIVTVTIVITSLFGIYYLFSIVDQPWRSSNGVYLYNVLTGLLRRNR